MVTVPSPLSIARALFLLLYLVVVALQALQWTSMDQPERRYSSAMLIALSAVAVPAVVGLLGMRIPPLLWSAALLIGGLAALVGIYVSYRTRPQSL